MPAARPLLCGLIALGLTACSQPPEGGAPDPTTGELDLGALRPDGSPGLDAAMGRVDAGHGVDQGRLGEVDQGGGGDDDRFDQGAPDLDAGADPLSWPAGENVWGAAQQTFSLPKPPQGQGLYVPDLQQSFPEVDWASLDRLYLPAGHYPFIRLGNLPRRDPERPLVITNQGGQVRVGGLDHYYLFAIEGGSNWVLTGRFDPVSQTGDAAFPGHRGGAFAHSQGTYGIVIDDEFKRDSVSGLSVGGGASIFEIEYVEIARVGFAGMLLKSDDQGQAHMTVRLHDNYIHDTVSEGVYIGSTQKPPQHQIRDLEIFNNRIVRTGTEAVQLGQLAGHARVHHNVFGPAAIDWRDAFQPFQDGNLQLSVRGGRIEVRDNVFLGSAGSMVLLFALPVEGDNERENAGVTIERNYFDGMRHLGMYINDKTLPQMSYRVAENAWTGWRYEREELHPEETPYGHLIRTFNNQTPIALEANLWRGPEALTNALPDAEGNATKGNVTGLNNSQTEVEAISFVRSGLEPRFDYLRLELWTATASLGGDAPVSYELGELVMYEGSAWRCELDPCPAGHTPPDHASTWTPLGVLADDVRVTPGSKWESYGLNASLAR